MQLNQYTLPNGLRIIHRSTVSKVAYCGFAIDAGTRDRAEDEQGMAHFVEFILYLKEPKKGLAHPEPYGERGRGLERH